jgi:hypothetical protein
VSAVTKVSTCIGRETCSLAMQAPAMMTYYDDAMRTIIDLPEAQVEALDAFCRRERISRAEAIRRAVDAHLARERERGPDPAFGVWADRPVDGLTFERRLRREWRRGSRR